VSESPPDPRASWGAEVFEQIYARSPDPWGFETSVYERGKYAETLGQLGSLRPVSALELGCSIGVMSQALAARCTRLLCLDAAPTALERARLRCAGLDHVTFRRGLLPADWPEGRFDLIMISELLYFLSPADVDELARRACEAALPGCLIVLVNWTGATDTPLDGDAAADLFCSVVQAIGSGFRQPAVVRREGYRLDRLERRLPAAAAGPG